MRLFLSEYKLNARWEGGGGEGGFKWWTKMMERWPSRTFDEDRRRLRLRRRLRRRHRPE